MGTRRTIKGQGQRRHFIREWRKYRGLTQEQLAGRVDAVVSAISQLENGKQGYSQAMLEDLAIALACEPWDLLNVDPTKEGDVVDLMRIMKDADEADRAAIIGYAQGRLGTHDR